jgi:chemotaxis protein MotB
LARQASSNENAGSGRWLLTYADMITLLLVFFIVLYSISKTNIFEVQDAINRLEGQSEWK